MTARTARTQPSRLRCMTHNIEGPDPAPQRRASFRAAVTHCVGGIGVLNEIHPEDVASHRQVLASLGLRWYRRGQNAIVWDPRVIRKHRCRVVKIMDGGYVGADGVAGRGEDRRVGPNRYAVKFLGEVIATGRPIMVVGIHKVAKAFTSAPWRQWLWRLSTRRVSRFVNRSIKNYPNGFIAGDENAPHLVDYPNLAERAVRTPPTHGRRRYDQVHTFGAAQARHVHEFVTASDHDGVEWTLLL